ncbi:unnamed protein product [Pleuronectes platessa]|uniref:Uncharacterized protein n=1 Tax=Pleuronectes platessa TaxID=8262 RepID=A0A9N7YVQ5_PLEPL|nr:unnamed protein product [Pleuronectes platessa]
MGIRHGSNCLPDFRVRDIFSLSPTHGSMARRDILPNWKECSSPQKHEEMASEEINGGERNYLLDVAAHYSADRALWIAPLLRRNRWDDERCPPVEEYVNTFDI